ncbi:RNA polymerase sigma-70 factor [Sphingobacterium alkalisoli]|uniref:RNA polymerase sigma-70 factor n=1 Tax=Sphingobacterium alkalisoli TaxID=1874115 RepID=A0A4U0GU56_9SPHI|nr:RNA polymerase sigma-70 factor [Sphingobacterium alkalisoli]TJY62601.1 RNA polymerase sigma-70 factor [Sphingobacterium alkalisoli]GGH27716.1 DNA-directed RNA polymerase sigma-70 factor [Sphingobacterium alkalisoli]
MEKITKSDYDHLLASIAADDQKSFSMLYDLFCPDLTRHVLSKVNEISVAEDIVHDLFLSLWKNRKNLLEIESLPAYLFSSCRYLVLAYYRKRATQEKYVDFLDYEFADSSLAIEDRLYYRYILDMIESEIENLPEKCREIFKLSRSSFLTNRQIAEKLAISESTVENHINKAIKRLRTITKKHFLFFLFF